MKIVLALFILLISAQLNAQKSLSDSIIKQKLIEASKYLSGIGVIKDEKKAFDIYQQCAAQGSPKAMNALGILYREGIGTSANKDKAVTWLTKAGKNGYAQGWYNLGMIYKDATNSIDRDYGKAYYYFNKAAIMDDDQSIYAKGFMLYKGFGCEQNYKKAAELFKLGAVMGRANSMYFLGLCFRNGYGISANIDSARYWLSKASQKGYKMADNELGMSQPENSNAKAKALASELRKNIPSMPGNINQYKKLEQNIPVSNIAGIYSGSIIKYEWSGEQAINSTSLELELNISNGNLVGKWIESDTVSIPFEAFVTSQSLIFKNTQYSRTDHYYPTEPVLYDFEKAKLKWAKIGDSVYLSGSIQMFSPSRNEPQKPLFISLVRKIAYSDKSTISLFNEDGTPFLLKNNIVAFPNPFTDVINVDFKLKQPCIVETQILTIDGKLVYRNNGGFLEAGNYTISVKPKQITSGTYILKLLCGKEFQTIKVIKQ
jgi:uncharacterized protein